MWEGVGFNLLCALYMWFLSPYVSAQTRLGWTEEGTSLWLSIVLGLVLLLETWAFPRKMRSVYAEIQAHRPGYDPLGANIRSILWVCHLVVTFVVFFAILLSLPLELRSVGCVVPLLVIRGLVFLVYVHPPNEHPPPGESSAGSSIVARVLMDAVLLGFACIAFDATWSAIASPIYLLNQSVGKTIFNVCVASLVFVVFYYPSRIPFLIEEVAGLRSPRDWLVFTLSQAVVLVSALHAANTIAMAQL